MIPIIYVLITFCFSLPHGPPICKINEQAITNGMGQKEPLKYSLIPTQVAKNTWDVRVHHDARVDYQGLLLYVTGTEPNHHLGSFTFQNQTKWKFQPESVCKAGNVVGSLQSTVAHANPDRVPIAKNVAFTWTASDDELKQPLVLNAVVASLDPGQQGVPRWQIISMPFAQITQTSPTVITTTTTTPLSILSTTRVTEVQTTTTQIPPVKILPTSSTTPDASAISVPVTSTSDGITYTTYVANSKQQPLITTEKTIEVIQTDNTPVPTTATQSSGLKASLPYLFLLLI